MATRFSSYIHLFSSAQLISRGLSSVLSLLHFVFGAHACVLIALNGDRPAKAIIVQGVYFFCIM